MIKQLDPNTRAYQKRMEKAQAEIRRKLKALAQYPEYDAYINELTLQHKLMTEDLRNRKVIKSWEDYVKLQAKIELLDDILDNSVDYGSLPTIE